MTDKFGYGNWVEIKKAIKRESRCRYDHLFVSRNEEEIKKRVIYLVQCLEKEDEERVKAGGVQPSAAVNAVAAAELEAKF